MIHDAGTKNNVQNQVANPIRGRTNTFEGESDTCDGDVVVRDGPQDDGLEHVGSGHVTSENLSMRLSSSRNSYSLLFCVCISGFIMFMYMFNTLCVERAGLLSMGERLLYTWHSAGYILRDTAFQCMHHSLAMLQCIAAVIFDTPEHTIIPTQTEINPNIKIHPKELFEAIHSLGVADQSDCLKSFLLYNVRPILIDNSRSHQHNTRPTPSSILKTTRIAFYRRVEHPNILNPRHRSRKAFHRLRYAHSTPTTTPPHSLCIISASVLSHPGFLSPGRNGELAAPKVFICCIECVVEHQC